MKTKGTERRREVIWGADQSDKQARQKEGRRLSERAREGGRGQREMERERVRDRERERERDRKGGGEKG